MRKHGVCTLIIFDRLFPKTPLLVAANRDENLDRPAEPPTLREQGGVRILAPRDLTAKGTWLGINEHGVFAALTNRFGTTAPKDAPSRGQLVPAALKAKTAAGAYAALDHLGPQSYAGFHLFIWDRNGAFLIINKTHALERRALAPGVHIITERGFGAAESQRELMLGQKLAQKWTAPPTIEALIALLSTRAPDGFNGVTVEVPAHNYGTRSSTILSLSDGAPRYLHAEGPPDQTPFDDHSQALSALGAPS